MFTQVQPPVSPDDCTGQDRPAVELPPETPAVRTEVRVVMVAPALGCDTSGVDPDDVANTPTEDTPLITLESDECVQITPLGNNKFKIGLPGCGSAGAALDFDQCGIKIAKGTVVAFTAPVMNVKSTDSSITVVRDGCEMDVRANPILTALPSRVLCATGPCAEAGRAIGVVNIVPVEGGGFQLQGCSLAGEGANGSALAYAPDVFDSLTAAVTAMNAAVLTAVFGSCGGGG